MTGCFPRLGATASCVALALSIGAPGCGPGVGEPMTAYDLPVVTSGGIEEQDPVAQNSPLTVTVEAVDDVDDETVAKIEQEIAFYYYAVLAECERGAIGWESPGMQGTVVVEFTIEPGGVLSGVQPVLTEGTATDPFAECIAGALEGALLENVLVDGMYLLHLMLRYGD